MFCSSISKPCFQGNSIYSLTLAQGQQLVSCQDYGVTIVSLNFTRQFGVGPSHCVGLTGGEWHTRERSPGVQYLLPSLVCVCVNPFHCTAGCEGELIENNREEEREPHMAQVISECLGWLK